MKGDFQNIFASKAAGPRHEDHQGLVEHFPRRIA
jgi:hypothetical protein